VGGGSAWLEWPQVDQSSGTYYSEDGSPWSCLACLSPAEAVVHEAETALSIKGTDWKFAEDQYSDLSDGRRFDDEEGIF